MGERRQAREMPLAQLRGHLGLLQAEMERTQRLHNSAGAVEGLIVNDIMPLITECEQLEARRDVLKAEVETLTYELKHLEGQIGAADAALAQRGRGASAPVTTVIDTTQHEGKD